MARSVCYADEIHPAEPKSTRRSAVETFGEDFHINFDWRDMKSL